MDAGLIAYRADAALDAALKVLMGLMLAVFPLIYGWAPVDAGGDTTVSQSFAVAAFEVCAGVMAAVMGFRLWFERRNPQRIQGSGSANAVLAAAAVFMALCALQFLPLPPFLHAFVTPEGARLLDKFDAFTPSGARPATLVPRATMVAFLKIAAFFIVFFAAARMPRKRGDISLFLGAVTVIGGVIAFLGLLKFFAGSSLPFLFPEGGAAGRASGPFINPNHFAGYLEICLPLSMGLFLISGPGPKLEGFYPASIVEYIRLQGSKKALVGLASLLMACGILASLSRLGIFSLLFSLFVFFFVLFRGRRGKLALGLVVFASFAALLCSSIYVGLDPMLERYSLLEDAGVNRLDAWKMGARIAADFPLTGTGIGTFRHISPLYQPPALKGGFHQAHNDYINIASDAGLPALAAVLIFLVLWVRTLLSVAAQQGRFRPVAAAAFVASVSAMAVHSIGDFNLQVASNGLLTAAVLGMGTSLGRVAQADSGGSGSWISS